MNVIHSTLLCWIPFNAIGYVDLLRVQELKGRIVEAHLSDTEAESKALKLNNQDTTGYYLAVYY